MSWTAKSENGLNAKPPGTPLGAGLGVVKVVVTWQPLQPIWLNSGAPALIAIRSLMSRGAGARNVMNVRKFWTSSWSSVRPPAQLPTASSVPAGTPLPAGWGGARSSQPAGWGTPLGADSVANAVIDVPLKQCCVVMPISFL